MMVARYLSCYRAFPFSKNLCADFPLLHSCHSIAVQCLLSYIFFCCAVAVQLLCHVSSAWRLLVCCVFHKDLLVLLLCNCHSFAVQFSSAWRSAWLLGFLKKHISFFTVQLLCNCCAMSPQLGDFWFSTNICLFCCCAIAIHLLCSSPQLGDQPVLCICCANI